MWSYFDRSRKTWVQIQYVHLTWLLVQQKILVFFMYSNNQEKFQTQLTSKTERDLSIFLRVRAERKKTLGLKGLKLFLLITPRCEYDMTFFLHAIHSLCVLLHRNYVVVNI